MAILTNDYTDFIKYCNDEITQYESSDITSIKYDAFCGNNVLQSLSFPKVTSVYNYAFCGMSNLEQISLPKVTYLGQWSLASVNKLTSISLPSIVTLGSYVFYNTQNLTTISAPNCTTVQENCFEGCTSLSQVDFLPTLNFIYRSAFQGCTSLVNAKLSSIISLYPNAFKNCTGLRKVWISQNCVSIPSKDFQDNEDPTYSPFYGCDSSCIIYTNAEAPNSNWSKYWNYYDNTHKLDVCWGASIQDYVDDSYRSKSTLENFVDGSIREIVYPDNITLIRDQFYGCEYLFNIELPTITNLPPASLWHCSGLKGEIPQMFPNVTTIEEVCFTNCTGLTSVDLSNVINVGDSVFQGCSNVRKVWLPSTCTTVGSPLFPNCYTVTFYTDASEDLPGWETNWNSLDWDNTRFGTVVYNATYEQYLQA